VPDGVLQQGCCWSADAGAAPADHVGEAMRQRSCIWHYSGVAALMREAALRPGAPFSRPSPEGSALRGASGTSAIRIARISRIRVSDPGGRR
jgi:hypothetical protein